MSTSKQQQPKHVSQFKEAVQGSEAEEPWKGAEDKNTAEEERFILLISTPFSIVKYLVKH